MAAELNQQEESVKEALARGECELCNSTSEISPCLSCRGSHPYLFNSYGERHEEIREKNGECERCGKFSTMVVCNGCRGSPSYGDDEDCFVRCWYMAQGRLAKWKLVLKEDLDFDCEEMATENVVLLYDQKRSAHPENKMVLEAWPHRSRRTFCHPVIRGNCLLIGRDPVTGNYRDLTEKDLEQLKTKDCLAEEMGSRMNIYGGEISPQMTIVMKRDGWGGMEMKWVPIPKSGLSGSGNSFEDASTEEPEKTSTEAKVGPMES